MHIKEPCPLPHTFTLRTADVITRLIHNYSNYYNHFSILGDGATFDSYTCEDWVFYFRNKASLASHVFGKVKSAFYLHTLFWGQRFVLVLSLSGIAGIVLFSLA